MTGSVTHDSGREMCRTEESSDMTAQNYSSLTTIDLQNPGIDASTLCGIAAVRPDLWESILRHSNCYPALAEWIQERSANAETSGSRHAPVEPEKSVRTPADEQPFQFSKTLSREWPFAGRTHWMVWVEMAIPAAAAAAIVPLSMPALSAEAPGYSDSISLFSDEFEGEGWYLLIGLLLTIAFAVTSIIGRKPWARIVAASVGILAGVFGALDGFTNAAAFADTPYVSVGSGLIYLGGFSTVLALACIASLLPKRIWRTE